MVWLWLACQPGATGTAGTAGGSTPEPPVTETPGVPPSADVVGTPPGTPLAEAPLRFAVIGDYGQSGVNEANVAALVASWKPDLILTAGDNNYPSGSIDTIDVNIGQYYSAWIGGYQGAYGTGPAENRFLACLGNHDWYAGDDLAAWYSYFDLPNNERYYLQEFGPATFVCTDSDAKEPDGIDSLSEQAIWIRDEMADIDTPWAVVFMHHPPFSSGSHGSTFSAQWPYGGWGADLVLAGHDHQYERLLADEVPYVIQGLGGASLRTMKPRLAQSQMAWVKDYGATLVDFSSTHMTLTTWSVGGIVIDTMRLHPTLAPSANQPVVRMASEWRYLTPGTDAPVGWNLPTFVDTTWKEGHAPLGWGLGIEGTALTAPVDGSVTTYFRKSFEVADLSWVSSAVLGLARDDGAVVYLNGEEVVRSNISAFGFDETSLATTALDDVAALAYNAWDIPIDKLVEGTNVLAVEVHQAAVGDEDMWLDASLFVVNASRLVASGAAWNWLDTGVAPASDWKAATFDDAAWETGPSPLGYGVDGLTTEIGYAGTVDNKFPTTWYRHDFTVGDLSAIDAALLRVVREDAGAVYVNGTEVWRQGLAPDAPPDALAAAVLPVGWADPWLETFIDPTVLTAGPNTIAVEVHRGSVDGASTRFDLELVAF